GPGQILGYPGAAYEILVSFSASYDFALAAKQCASLTGLVLVVSIPIAVFIAPNVAVGLLGRDVEPVPLGTDMRCARAAFLLIAFTVPIAVILPLTGIIQPLFTEFPAARAFQELERTALDTFVYALTAGVVATVLGTILAIAVGRQKSLRASVVI